MQTPSANKKAKYVLITPRTRTTTKEKMTTTTARTPHENSSSTRRTLVKVSGHRRSHELVRPIHLTKSNISIVKRKDVTEKPKVEKSHHRGNIVLKEDWEKKKKAKHDEIVKKNSPDFMIGSFFSKIYKSIFD